MRKIPASLIFPLIIPLLGALWLTTLMGNQQRPEWKSPDPEFQGQLEQGLIFAFSPLISWVNRMEKSGPPDEQSWTREAHDVLTQSPELQDIAWLISEQGTTKIFRQESRSESGALPLEKIDGEIFSFVKKGERPYGFAYRDGGHAFFEFQIPLQTGTLFHGVLLARYSLPQFLSKLTRTLPSNASLVLWKQDEILARSQASQGKFESFFLPLDIWGKKLTVELQLTETPPVAGWLPLRWLAFLVLTALAGICFLFREPPLVLPLEGVSPEWFAAVAPTASGTAPLPQNTDDGPLPVWALAQKERIAEELKKAEPPTPTEKP